MLKAIVFDFDGVIVDSEPLHFRAFLRVAQQRLSVNFDYQEYMDKYIGFDDRDAFRVMMGLPAGEEGSSADEVRVRQMVEDKAEAFETVVREGIETIPGMVELIRAAGARMPIAIASGATRRDIDLILGVLGLSSLFKTIVTADMVKRSKPHPESYAMAVRKLAELNGSTRDLTPGACLAIEDTAAGIESARGAGLQTLGLASTGPAEKLSRANRVVTTAKGLTVDQLSAWYG